MSVYIYIYVYINTHTCMYMFKKYVTFIILYIINIYMNIIYTRKYMYIIFSKYMLYVYLYIDIINIDRHTHILRKQKRLFWMRLIVINRLTPLVNLNFSAITMLIIHSGLIFSLLTWLTLKSTKISGNKSIMVLI